jgi:hypothetical protein
MARIKSATTINPKRLRRPKHRELLQLLPMMESLHAMNGYGIRTPEDYRHHWRKPKNSKPKLKK